MVTGNPFSLYTANLALFLYKLLNPGEPARRCRPPTGSPPTPSPSTARRRSRCGPWTRPCPRAPAFETRRSRGAAVGADAPPSPSLAEPGGAAGRGRRRLEAVAALEANAILAEQSGSGGRDRGRLDPTGRASPGGGAFRRRPPLPAGQTPPARPWTPHDAGAPSVIPPEVVAQPRPSLGDRVDPPRERARRRGRADPRRLSPRQPIPRRRRARPPDIEGFRDLARPAASRAPPPLASQRRLRASVLSASPVRPRSPRRRRHAGRTFRARVGSRPDVATRPQQARSGAVPAARRGSAPARGARPHRGGPRQRAADGGRSLR